DQPAGLRRGLERRGRGGRRGPGRRGGDQHQRRGGPGEAEAGREPGRQEGELTPSAYPRAAGLLGRRQEAGTTLPKVITSGPGGARWRATPWRASATWSPSRPTE